MLFDLKNKIVIITGASSGIGAELGRACARKGAKVVLAARAQERIQALQQEIVSSGGEAFAIKTDVTIQDDRHRLVDETIRRWGGVDVLINNAGYSLTGLFDQLPLDEVRKNFETNVFGAVALTQAVLPFFQKKKSGVVVNIESIVALRSMPTSSCYSATKHALHAFSEGLRMEVKKQGIHVLSVCPGLIDTAFGLNRIQIGQRTAMGPQMFYMPVEKCAAKIIRAIEWKRSQIVVTGHAKIIAYLQRISPRFLDFIFANNYQRALVTKKD
jgi:short-subunit dehydrogenase